MMELVVLVAVLLGATAFGWWRRSTDGRIRTMPAVVSGEPGGCAAGTDAPLPGVAADHLMATDYSEPLIVGGDPLRASGSDAASAGNVMGPGDLGQPLGDQASLVQFSSAFCTPCRATRVVLADVAAMVPGVVHVEVDAESHLDLVRRLDVTRTPTVFVLDRTGRIRSRATGAPRKADVIAALGQVV